MAIHDGAHVISVSILGFDDYERSSEDFTAIASFHAHKNGINVLYCAGNAGPNPQSVMNLSPWVFTVAANTIDRDFQARVQLQNGKIFVVSNLSRALPQGRFYPMIAGPEARRTNSTIDDANSCTLAIDPKKVKDKILVCKSSGVDDANLAKGYAARQTGAAAMIIVGHYNAIKEIPDMHFLPAAHIKDQDARALFSYLKSTKKPMATIHPPTDVFDLKPSPIVADFSSRGPSKHVQEILKVWF
ncbi:hypothetical protein K1719_006373 [Acacia pycnantha]|nr:hypothetical protein K1719_006373 [Acacia pycnantha]